MKLLDQLAKLRDEHLAQAAKYQELLQVAETLNPKTRAANARTTADTALALFKGNGHGIGTLSTKRRGAAALVLAPTPQQAAWDSKRRKAQGERMRALHKAGRFKKTTAKVWTQTPAGRKRMAQIARDGWKKRTPEQRARWVAAIKKAAQQKRDARKAAADA